MQWLLERRADWRLTDEDGRTALAIAQEEGKAEAAAALEAWVMVHGTPEEKAEVPAPGSRGAHEGRRGCHDVDAAKSMHFLDFVALYNENDGFL